MNNDISVVISNWYRTVIESTGEGKFDVGTTTIEARSARSGDSISLYILEKGFGRSGSKSTRTKIDNKTARDLFEFLKNHLEFSAKADAMNEMAQDHHATEKYQS